VGKFSSEFGKMIAEVTGPEIKLWLQALKREGSKENADAARTPVSNRTRNNFRVGIQTLFSFAREQGYLPLDWKGMECVPVWKTRDDTVEIFEPEELSVLLGLATEETIPFLTIGAFAGLRSAEIERLDWSKVNLKTGYITVDASIAKTNSRRLVPITPNLRLWLEKVGKASGPVVEEKNVARSVRALTAATRPADPGNPKKWLAPAVSWKHNVLRHSFCSYRLADVKSAAQVALEAGNSPQMVFKHYRELVTEEAARRWFAITPQAVEGLEAQKQREREEKVVALNAEAVVAA
jgi:integrase